MKTIIRFYAAFAIILIAFLSYHGCSEVADNLVLAPTIGAHPAGFTDENSPNFHGKYIFANKLWNLTACVTCHGGDYAGGNTGKSCLTCHTASGGPENCRLCHGNENHSWPPKALNGDSLTTNATVGAHNTHLDPDSSVRYSARVACSECHAPIVGFKDPNHIGASPDGIAEVTFGELARDTIGGDTLIPNPTWDRNTGTCSSVYCHGNFKAGNRNAQPVFNDENSVVCGSCHGNPTTGNPNPITTQPPHSYGWQRNQCYLCHNSMINQSGDIINKSLHINGIINGNITY
jgi:predicted CxxxxCH...CXXCH cytochrome family protein